MSKETDQNQSNNPVFDENGKPTSGIFSFESLSDNPVIAEEIYQFILNEQIKELQGKIDESNKRLQEIKNVPVK